MGALSPLGMALWLVGGIATRNKNAPGWDSSRRAVGDLIGCCLREEVGAPVDLREELFAILEMLCSQTDYHLDSETEVTSEDPDYFSLGINNTRSVALESVVDFGFWLRRSSRETDITPFTDILERRFVLAGDLPFTLPERAILAFNYPRVLSLDSEWGALHRGDFFPQGELSHWTVAFGTYLRHSNLNLQTFSVLRRDYEFAVSSLATVSALPGGKKDFVEALGQHLFMFFVWGEYPLTGDDSLIEQFYEAVGDSSGHCRFLFDHVGRVLRNALKPLPEEVFQRVMNFLNGA